MSQVNRSTVVALIVASACARQPHLPVPAPTAQGAPSRPLPSFCTADLSDWTLTHDTPFVPAAIATRAVRPAVLGLQQRLCACISTAANRPASLRFVFVATPNQGRTEVKPGVDVEQDVAACVGTFIATYPPFDFRGDVLECASDDYTSCTSPPASFVMPLEFPLLVPAGIS